MHDPWLDKSCKQYHCLGALSDDTSHNQSHRALLSFSEVWRQSLCCELFLEITTRRVPYVLVMRDAVQNIILDSDVCSLGLAMFVPPAWRDSKAARGRERGARETFCDNKPAEPAWQKEENYLNQAAGQLPRKCHCRRNKATGRRRGRITTRTRTRLQKNSRKPVDAEWAADPADQTRRC